MAQNIKYKAPPQYIDNKNIGQMVNRGSNVGYKISNPFDFGSSFESDIDLDRVKDFLNDKQKEALYNAFTAKINQQLKLGNNANLNAYAKLLGGSNPTVEQGADIAARLGDLNFDIGYRNRDSRQFDPSVSAKAKYNINDNLDISGEVDNMNKDPYYRFMLNYRY